MEEQSHSKRDKKIQGNYKLHDLTLSGPTLSDVGPKTGKYEI